MQIQLEKEKREREGRIFRTVRVGFGRACISDPLRCLSLVCREPLWCSNQGVGSGTDQFLEILMVPTVLSVGLST